MMAEKYTPENLESIAAELPKWAARLGADLYHCIDAWAADRQRIRKLEADLYSLRDSNQDLQKVADYMRRELDAAREENQRLRKKWEDHDCVDEAERIQEEVSAAQMEQMSKVLGYE